MWNGWHTGGLHGAGVHIADARGRRAADQDSWEPGDDATTVSSAISHSSGWRHICATFLINFDQRALDFNHGAAFDRCLRTLNVGLGLTLDIHFGAFQGSPGRLQLKLRCRNLD